MTMHRIEIRGTVLYTRQYKRVKKRNSYTIVYDKNNSKQFGSIEYFVFIHEKVVAVLKPILPLNVNCKEHFNLSTTILDEISFVHPVYVSHTFTFCFVEEIVSKCLFVDFNLDKYIVQFPSSLLFD